MISYQSYENHANIKKYASLGKTTKFLGRKEPSEPIEVLGP